MGAGGGRIAAWRVKAVWRCSPRSSCSSWAWAPAPRAPRRPAPALADLRRRPARRPDLQYPPRRRRRPAQRPRLRRRPDQPPARRVHRPRPASPRPGALTSSPGVPADKTTSPEAQFEVCVPDNGDICKAGTRRRVRPALPPPGRRPRLRGQRLSSPRATSPTAACRSSTPRATSMLMFGGEVNKTKVEAVGSSEAEENLCPFDPADVCQQAAEGTGNGQFGAWVGGDFIAIDTMRARPLRRQGLGRRPGPRSSASTPPVSTRARSRPRQPCSRSTSTPPATSTRSTAVGVHKLTRPTLRRAPADFFSSPNSTKRPRSPPRSRSTRPATSTPSARPTPATPPTRSSNSTRPATCSNSSALENSTPRPASRPTSAPAASRPATSTSPTPAEPNAFLRAYGTQPARLLQRADRRGLPDRGARRHPQRHRQPQGTRRSPNAASNTAPPPPTTSTVPARDRRRDRQRLRRPSSVHADISGLDKGTVYHFRLLANVGGEPKPAPTPPSRPSARP